MAILFDIIYAVLFVLYLPVLKWKGKLHAGYPMRMGRIPPDIQQALATKPNIWIHAVSVGEVLAVADLIDKLMQRFPDKRVVCSVVTDTGYAVAREKLPGGVQVIYAPLDFSWVVRRFVKLIRPEIYIFAETEIWPNLFDHLHAAGVPMIQVNGRISDKSFGGYKRLRPVTRRVLGKVDRFLMQSQTDADRICELGAHPVAVRVPGNLKFDSLPEAVVPDPARFGLGTTDQPLIAGSTHPGEEEILLDVFAVLKQAHPAARLIICPRHVTRCDEVLSLIRGRDMTGVALSAAQETGAPADAVIVVDTMGQLRDLYSVARVVFVGKTFTVQGGQNMIEPGFFGKPVIVGPYTQNFKDVMTIFKREKAIVQVNDPDELREELLDIWDNAIRRESLGMAARRVVEKFQGATEKTLLEIETLGPGRQDAAIH